MNTIRPLPGETGLSLLTRCDGYYDKTGSDGPVVGYAATYLDEGVSKHYVGHEFADFAMIERHGPALQYVAQGILSLVSKSPLVKMPETPVFIGLPEGGKALATALALESGGQYIFPEKKVLALKTENSREKSEMYFGRHRPKPGDKCFIVEDVCNEFSTTDMSITLIESFGAEVAGILCFFNRSMTVRLEFKPGSKTKSASYPVVAFVNKQMNRWRQDDPVVANDVAKGNVVWKPKDVWHEKISPFVTKG